MVVETAGDFGGHQKVDEDFNVCTRYLLWARTDGPRSFVSGAKPGLFFKSSLLLSWCRVAIVVVLFVLAS